MLPYSRELHNTVLSTVQVPVKRLFMGHFGVGYRVKPASSTSTVDICTLLFRTSARNSLRNSSDQKLELCPVQNQNLCLSWKHVLLLQYLSTVVQERFPWICHSSSYRTVYNESYDTYSWAQTGIVVSTNYDSHYYYCRVL